MYYQGNTEIQADGLQTLYLMNPNYNAYSDTSQQSGNMFIFNYPAGNRINLESLPNENQPQPHLEHLVGVPLQTGSLYSTTTTTATPGRGSGGSIAHLHQNLWSSLDHENQENGNVHSGVVVPSSYGGGQAEVSVAQLGYHHLPSVSPTQQGLSLSLSSQQHHNINHVVGNLGMGSPGTGGGNFKASGGGACSSVSEINTNGIQRESGFLLESKYLKAAQELLDEVVSIAAKEIKAEKEEKEKTTNKESIKMVLRGEASGVGETSMATELTAAQKQEIQMKKAKLISMLDEVEQRYGQYHHQMQIVVTTFEHATGVGSARSYTQLALKTISKQFRCLKDAISEQIKTANKNLGLEEILEGKIHGSSSSRLKFVDQQHRQQKALQHFGMIQTNNVWRPQRGLPERAVSVLRAWLFDHFLHPYPKDSDKIMLAKQTGLTRSQVSNWFINARVRLWKPMVEEMYTEEMKNQESILGSESKNQDHSDTIKSANPKDYNITMMMTDKDNYNNTKLSNQEKETSPDDISEISRFGLVSELNNSDVVSDKNPKRQRPVDHQHHHHNYHHIQNSPISTMLSSVDMMEAKYGDPRAIGNGLIGAFSFGDLENFNPQQLTAGFHGNNGGTGGGASGGGVSLTLGLPPSNQQNNFFSNQNMELRSTHHMNIGYNETLRFPNS